MANYWRHLNVAEQSKLNEIVCVGVAAINVFIGDGFMVNK